MVLTLEKANKAWTYDPVIGELYWNVSTRYGISAGSKAGSFDGRYWRVKFEGKNYKRSRLAWLMFTGKWPEHQIDHINGEKVDDRIVNLREATASQNSANRPVKITNTIGLKGVSKHYKRDIYMAILCKDGIVTYIGSFKTPIEAKLAYDRKAMEILGEFART